MSTPFYEVSFPSRIARGAEAIVRSRTSVHSAGGGQEHRAKRWSFPLREFDASRGIRNNADLELVRAFHVVMGGRHAGFRFRDFSDCTLVSQPLDTSAGGTGFQLRKGYTAGDVTRWRAITKPVAGTLLLYLNGDYVAVINTGQTIADWVPVFGETPFGFNPEAQSYFTLDPTTGALTSSEELAEDAELIATCDFEVKARFGSDEFRVRALSRGRNWEYGQILIKETR